MQLAHADSSSADLSNDRLFSTDLDQVNFQYARLVGADFNGASLDHAQFDHAQLNYAHFVGATASNATFTNAVLDDAHFNRLCTTDPTVSTITILTHADFTGASLRKATLSGVTFGHDEVFADTHIDGAFILHNQAPSEAQTAQGGSLLGAPTVQQKLECEALNPPILVP